MLSLIVQHGSSDWNTKEDLAGQTCGISSNYNDRVLPTITSDTTIQHCFGNCAFDGTCNPPVTPTYDLTLSVNTAGITVGSNGMYAGGGILGDAMAVPLYDADGDGTWTGTVTMNTGVTGNYIFLNSPSNGGDWGAKEDLNGLACSDPNNYNDRILPYITGDTTMLHCFGSCETDGSCPAPPSVFYNVTFQVDASNIVVGPNGIYAGGGILGDAMAYPLSDADGDGIWETTISLADGTSGNYIFLNSPSNGGDWGAKEDLSGLPCADPANWNDRILPAVTADVTIPYCFGTCDASCPTPPGCYYTVAMVDSYGDGWNGGSIDVSVGGNVVANWTLTGFTASGTDSVYTVNGDNVSFTWNGGTYDSEVSFTITDPAGTTIYTGGAPPAGSTFASDVSVSSCQPAPVNITFQVDMGLVTTAFTTPEINGSWNNWAGGSNPMTDADGDNVWEGTISLLPGSYEYKFAADNWTSQETNDPNAPCTNGNATYTNRTLIVSNVDVTLPAVCWGSCDPCVYPPVAGTCGFFNLELTDSWGDGWNGGSIDVVVNGTTVFAGLTIANGSGPDVYQIPVDIGDVVDFIYTAGSYPGENAYQVFDQNGVLIVDQGAGSSTPSSVTGVNACPACADPSSLVTSNSTTTTVDFGWTSNGTETAWNVEYGSTGFTVGSGTLVAVTSNPTTITGLSANTSYDLYVQADCGSGTVSSWVGPITVTTNSLTVAIPSCEDFETGSPSVTTSLNAASNASATVLASAAAGSSSYGVQLTGMDSFTSGAWTGGSVTTTESQAWNTNTTCQSNVSFNVDATNESVVILTFDLRQTYTFGPAYSWFRVTVDGTQIGNSLNPTSNTDPFVNHSYDLSAYAGTSFNLKLEHAGKYSPAYSSNYPGDNSFIDNICISAPSCLSPVALSASNITSSGADLSWTPSGSETVWNVDYGPTGYTVGTGTSVSSANYTVSGLTPQTDYDFYVQADCGSGDVSSWVGPFTFTTSCAAAAAPYFENFDAGFPLCWTQSTTDDADWTLDANGTPSSSTGPSDDMTGGGNYMFIETSGGSAGKTFEMHSQSIDLSTLSSPELRFYSHMYGSSMGTLNVDVTNDNGATYTNIFTKSGDQGNQWNEEIVPLSLTGSVSFKITGIRGSSFRGDLAIDNFEVREDSFLSRSFCTYHF